MFKSPGRSAEMPKASKRPMIDAKSQQQAQHTATISLIVKNTGKIQKEIGFRRARLKSLYQHCQETIDMLNVFKDEQWPPAKSYIIEQTHPDDAGKGDTPDVSAVTEDGVVEVVVESETSLEPDGSDSSFIDQRRAELQTELNEENERKRLAREELAKEIERNDTNSNNSDDEQDHKETQDSKELSLSFQLRGADVNEESDTISVKSMDSVNFDDDDAGVDDAVESDAKDRMDDESVHSEDDADLEQLEVDDAPSMCEESADLSKENDVQDEESSFPVSMDQSVSSLTEIHNEDNESQESLEHMRPEVIAAIECYCTVINSSLATAKMIEIALECIGLLISNRYVVGSTIISQEIANAKGNKESIEERRKITGIMDLISSICECADNPTEAVQSAMSKDLLSLMTSPVCKVHEAGMLKSVRTVFHIYLITKHEEAKQTCRAVLQDMLKSVFQRMEAYDAFSDQECVNSEAKLPNGKSLVEDSNSVFASRFHTDSYLLFRALCKLSAKTLPEDSDEHASSNGSGNIKMFSGSKNGVSDPMATETKILSLELILCIFEHCGSAFRNGPKFIYAVQNFLCVSLLKNCISSNTRVAHLSLQIFLLLVYKFKKHMKSEIEVFIANVFLPVLESPNCPLERKSLVLEALRALCADPHLLTSIFLNYDCDFDAVNLYKTILHHLTSLAVRGRSGAPTSGSKHKLISDDFKISVAGLEVLVVILQGFLKALNLPGGEDAIDEQRSKVRGILQLDVGLAAKDKIETTTSDDDLNSGEDIQIGTEDLALKIVDAFDKKQLAQQNFETGCIKFKLSFKQGNGFLSLDARDFARFFLDNREKLDLTQIGEVFGKEPDASFVKDTGIDPEKGGEGFYIRVLHHYVNQLDFAGVKFDDAIRLFLSGFRLPGESQKVDRIMEKFAERYTLQNDDVFPSADTAFILAFAVIMLQTDLHNPNIKPEKKLSQEGFVKMNKGISVDGGDLPAEFLIDIYQSIKQRPFTLKEDDDARRSQIKKAEGSDINDVLFGSVVAEERKRERFKKESAVLFESTEKLFKKSKPTNGAPNSDFASSINPADVIKPMFDITWGPLLGSLSQIMEKAEDDSSIALSLNGFVYAVRIASHTNTSLARSTFMNALAKFTALGSMRELKPRNIECIRTLLSIAIVDGEHLEDSWVPVLQCISQLGRLIFVASGLDYDDNFLHNEKKSNSSRKLEAKDTEQTNSRVVLEAINEILIEKVFSASTKLSDKGVMHLIQSLVLVSRSEIEGDSKKDISGVRRTSVVTSIEKDGKDNQNITGDGPRVFSLQKLVEVADYNMASRSRLSWAKIWGVMSHHFVAIGCHDNQNVSLFAIDALRQLSNKFLEKSELADFNFQRMFLKPFLDIMDNTSSLSDTREVILQCVDNMIRSKYDNIRSGWKIFFSILALAANDSAEKNNILGLRILQRLVDERLEDFCSQGRSALESEKKYDEETVSQKELSGYVDDFIGLVRASMAFVTTTKALPPGVSMRALCHVACYADQISKGNFTLPIHTPQSHDPSLPGYTYEGLDEKETYQMMLWRPIFDGLASGICSKATSRNYGVGCFVQRGSVMTVRAILLRHGYLFSANQWKAVLQQSILPSFVIAVENDKTPAMDIISESPNVSNLDFLSDPLPLPPHENDPSLLKFAALVKESQSTTKRDLGPAELIVEAGFADFRHGGNGDLRNAHSLFSKDAIGKNVDEPFPDSWVSTTGPIALGMLTDFFIFIVIKFPIDDVSSLWTLTVGQIQTWIVGSPFRTEDSQSSTLCEALSRIGSSELTHLTDSLLNLMPQLEETHRVRFVMGHLCESFAHTLSHAVDLEMELLSTASSEIHNFNKNIQSATKSTFESEDKTLNDDTYDLNTMYGKGRIVLTRDDEYPDGTVKIATVELESGSKLFCLLTPDMENRFGGSVSEKSKNSESTDSDVSGTIHSKREIMTKFISPLRILCTSVFCLQQSLFALLDLFSVNCSENEVSLLLDAVEKSRRVACEGTEIKDLSSYFQEAYLMETGARVEEVQAAFSSDSGIGHVGRYEMYYLTQESSANNVLVRFLSFLYCLRADSKSNNWDTVLYAEPLLVARMIDVLQKFITSERSVGHKIDPNVWRTASDSGGKFAVHCTSFATIVVNILYTMVNFSDEQFERLKGTLFPILCSLISVQSEEIRKQVANVFITKVGNLLNKTRE